MGRFDKILYWRWHRDPSAKIFVKTEQALCVREGSRPLAGCMTRFFCVKDLRFDEEHAPDGASQNSHRTRADWGAIPV
jgi:hypothetical protein